MNEDNFFEFEDVDGGARSPHLIPWLVTGLIAIVALLIAVVVLNVSRGALNAEPEPAPPAVEEPSEAEPPASETPETSPEPESDPEPPVGDNPDDAIDTSHVVAGETYFLEVEWGWNISTEVPNKLIPWTYTIPDGVHLQLDSELINSLPASCEAQKNSWGLEKTEDGKIKAWSPQQMCEENQSLYTELLGLVRHMEETVKPLSNN
ncbi:MAG TPA: hypothetical protein VLZ31_07260 [Microbacteriaceae bacterium]|nr:hypothetical protein [Microbacteriaceae bacterium]